MIYNEYFVSRLAPLVLQLRLATAVARARRGARRQPILRNALRVYRA